MQINPGDFLPQRRPLPVIVLADVSTSMEGEKINTLNAALTEMHQKFQTVHDTRSKIHTAIITFASNAQQILSLTPVENVKMPTLTAAGTTSMGAAFNVALQLLQDEQQLPKRSYLPTLVLVSDGQPNDDWEEPLQKLLDSDRGKRAVRLALGIGDDCDFDVLKRFVNHPEIPVVRAAEVSKLMDFFQFVSMSVMARSVAQNPNSTNNLPLHLLDNDDLSFD
ncbi:VWA domain-containing protein [Nostoc sp. FACHB-87]|uniref:vWA domain-containing protein n=1 Tax=Nostocaceae TaxID=1162 RepID=UPI00168773BA|nr:MULTISPECIES: VWA domain-containing protein [Nostocaceae]MBD2458770.1 VWA domain-containing protein [Nostoc sp. FACHB-87]MBD2479810.1 VWA domain-containing protein [Anabaena sp. FACHB-83]